MGIEGLGVVENREGRTARTDLPGIRLLTKSVRTGESVWGLPPIDL